MLLCPFRGADAADAQAAVGNCTAMQFNAAALWPGASKSNYSVFATQHYFVTTRPAPGTGLARFTKSHFFQCTWSYLTVALQDCSAGRSCIFQCTCSHSDSCRMNVETKINESCGPPSLWALPAAPVRLSSRFLGLAPFELPRRQSVASLRYAERRKIDCRVVILLNCSSALAAVKSSACEAGL